MDIDVRKRLEVIYFIKKLNSVLLFTFGAQVILFSGAGTGLSPILEFHFLGSSNYSTVMTIAYCWIPSVIAQRGLPSTHDS